MQVDTSYIITLLYSPIVSHLKIKEFEFYENIIFEGGKSLCQKIEKSRKLSANVAKTKENRKEKRISDNKLIFLFYV